MSGLKPEKSIKPIMDKRRCPYCGEEVLTWAVRCSHCSRAIETDPQVMVQDPFTIVKGALSSRFEIVAEIGQGGNATVYQAIQKNLDRKVALKILLPHLVADQGFLERFHFEARAIAKLRHPNIVTIYDEGCENGVHFMSMEFLEGKDLQRLVKQCGALKVNEVMDMVRCIAAALDFAHSYGIVHRDVKSSNIIMTSARTAVLTDFGIAQSGYKSSQSKPGPVLGTPEFMSPEQAAGKQVDLRSDFYSLGVVLYHVLSGRYPFRGETPLATLNQIMKEEPVPIGKLVKLPASLENAIDRCLVKDPATRVQNGKELLELISPRPVEVKAPPADGVRTGTSRGSLVRFVGFVVIVWALGLGFLVWKHRTPAHVPPHVASVPVQTAVPVAKQVPDVVGLTKEDAFRILQNEGFLIGGVRVVAVPDPGKKGRVDSQRPLRGVVAKSGSTVDLFIAE